MISLTATPISNTAPPEEECSITGTLSPTAPPGMYSVTVTVTDSGSPQQRLTLTITLTVNPSFSLASAPPQTGEVGASYMETVTPTGGAGLLTSCAITPAGTGLTAALANGNTSCAISGTPTAGTTMATLTVMDAGSPPTGPQTTMFTFAIDPALTVGPFIFGAGEVGQPYSLTVGITGGIPPYKSCALPAAVTAIGLTVVLNGTNCVISGSPTATFGPTSEAVSATDSGSSSTAPVTANASSSLTVDAKLVVPAFAFATGEVGSAYSLTIPVAGGFTTGILPLTACNIPGLPAGLMVAPFVSGNHGAMADSCQVTGTPTAAFGPMSLTLTATDSGSANSTPAMASNSASLTVNAQLTIPAFTLGNGEIGAVYSQTIPAAGGFTTGILPITNCSFSPTLPAGLAVAPFASGAHGAMADSCQVTGTPTATFGPMTVTLSATDTGSADSTKSTAMTASSNMFQVFPALALTNMLGNGEVNAPYSSLAPATEPAISGGNTAATSYTCVFSGAAPAGLNVAWNGVLGANAGCTVSGTPTAVFPSAPVSIMVTEASAPSSSSAAGTVTSASNAIQIFSTLNISVLLGNGEINAPYSSTNLGATEPAISGGNPAATSYACSFVGSAPAGLTAVWNNVTGANAGCTVSGTPTMLFGPAPVTIHVTEAPAPSLYSAAGAATGTYSNVTIYSALSLSAMLGNGEVNALYSSTNAGATEPAISGGNPATTAYACTFTGTSPAGLTAVWNGSTGAAAGCTVSGTPTAVFGMATTTIQVTDMTPSPYSATGSFTATSNSIQIFPQVTLAAFTLGAGETSAGYSHTGIAITPGITPAVAYTCTSATLPAGLTASASGAACQVTGMPTATYSAPVTIMVTENSTPSPYSAAGTNSTSSTGNLVISAGVTFAGFTLGDGVVGSPFNQNPAPAFSGGNTAAAYTCTLLPNPAPLPDGLTAAWNLTAPPGAAACNVTGTPTTAIPSPGVTVQIQVQDTPLSADQSTPSTAVASSQANFEIFPALMIVNPKTINDLVNVAYPGITFTATGGLSNGANVTWTAPGNTSGSGLCTPPNGPAPLTGLPPGLTLNPSTGALTGTPTMTGVYTFVVCVEDNPGAATTSTNPVGVNSSPAVTIKILGHLAFASGTNDSTIQVIDVSSNTFVQSINLAGVDPGAVPAGIALNAEGGFAFVADNANNMIIPIDTVALTPLPPVPVPGCSGPTELAATPNQTLPGSQRLYVLCNGEIAVFKIATPATPTFLMSFPSTPPVGLAIQGDNSKVFVTFSGFNILAVFDNTTNPPTVLNQFNLNVVSTQGNQLAVVPNGNEVYAYIGKTGPESVEVDDVTGVTSTTSATLVTNISTSGSAPDVVTADPLQSHVYVTLPSTNQFDVLDNTIPVPVLLIGAPFGLPTPVVPGADSAGGVTVPPNTSGTFPFSAYFTVPAISVVDVTDDSGAPAPAMDLTKDPASPITGLTTLSTPRRIASIPIPAAGLGFKTMTLPNAVAARSYTVYAVIRDGTAPFTCSSPDLPSGLTVATSTVTGGPLNGQPACFISGTAPGAGASTVTLTVTDNSSPVQMTSSTFNFTIRPEFAFSAPTALPDGVGGRTYGAAAETSPVESTNVSASVGNSPLMTCSVSGAGGTTLTSAVSGTAGCDLSSANIILPFTPTVVNFNLTFSATDTPIKDPFTMLVAVPAGTISTTSTVPLNLNPALMITSGFNPPAWTANATNAYPTQMVTVAGGIQSSLACMLTGYTSGLMVTPSAGVCALNGDPTVANAPGGAMITITFSDGGNTAVPPPSASGMPSVSGTIVVNAQAALTTLEAAFTDGVTNNNSGAFVNNRPYSITASASGGTGTLTLSNPGPTLNVGNCAGLNLSSTPASGTVSGMVAGNPSVVGPTGNGTAPCSFSLTVTDTTGTATTTAYMITIHAPLQVTFAPNPGFGIGVSGQPFSQTLTATGGLQPLTACTVVSGVPASLTTGFTGSTCTLSGTPMAGDQGTTTPVITLTDSADSSTAAGSINENFSPLTINPPLAITLPARIINALSGFAYPSAPTLPAAVTYTVAAGTGTGSAATLTAAANAAGAVCGAQGSAGTFPMGTLTFTNQTGTSAELAGTPTSATSTLYSFPICAVDSGSSSTAAYAVNTSTNVNLAVLSPTAYAAGTGTNTLEAFSTSLASTPNTAIDSITLSATPQGVAVTPDGRYVIVTEQGTPDQIDVIDTTTNAPLANSPFSLAATNCGTPVGVAADAQFVYIACDSTTGTNKEEVLVLDEVMLTTGNAGAGAFSVTTQIVTGVGSAPDSIAFNPADTRANVTLSGTDQMMIIDNTATPPAPIMVTQTGNPQGVFNLPATTATPREIAVLQNTASGSPLDYAYIAKQTGTSSTISFVSASKQKCDTTAANANVLTCTLPAATTAGNTLIVMVAINPATSTVTSVVDSTSVLTIAADPNGAAENAGQTTATITTTTNHGLSAGQTVTIAGVANPFFDGTFTVVTTPTLTTFTVANTAPASSAKSGNGTVSFGAASTYSLIPGCAENSASSYARIECWATAPNAAVAAHSVSVTVSGAAPPNIVMTVAEYSGVTGFGTPVVAQSLLTSPSISVTTVNPNDFCVAGFAERRPSGSFGALVTGVDELSSTTGGANGDVGGAFVDNGPIVTPGACTTSISDTGGGGANSPWALAAVELTSGIPAGVDVVDVTVRAGYPTSAGLTVVTSIAEPSGSTPFGVAGLPGTPSGRAYITLPGSNQFDVIDNTVVMPVKITGAPFNLPDPSMAAGSVNPMGVVIPPSTSTAYDAYITFTATGQVGIMDDNSPAAPTADPASPFGLAGGGLTAPGRVAAIPVPQ